MVNRVLEKQDPPLASIQIVIRNPRTNGGMAIRDHRFAVGGGFHHEDFYFIILSVGVSRSASFFLT